ncbi:hypothetical protein JRK18_003819 [Salmonella enterica]|uniref:hypothetical protein n=2 Tax=Salmonella enterica TaxID=28901 RepID=UPI000A99EF9D|nr:hypothetical protein [Salmonella enterica]ECF4139123.1 hypothetical protein [Salmonella enterica subsp. enterica serovar Bareilly]EAX6576957.1 hypothetical protein [Salmonella enterica]EBP0111869.1 hypothetical protein [Salmonella enterica]EED3241159.1 hypothetical protein [Salmonella enterica subsp. enterica serovar Bareilly]EHD2110613.1 hypothetical protein [Salmonella enterica]
MSYNYAGIGLGLILLINIHAANATFRTIENSTPLNDTRSITLTKLSAWGDTISGEITISGWTGGGNYWQSAPSDVNMNEIYFTFVNAFNTVCSASYNGVFFPCNIKSSNISSGWTWGYPNKIYKKTPHTQPAGENSGSCASCYYDFPASTGKITVSGVPDGVPYLNISAKICNSHIKADGGYVEFDTYASYCSKSTVLGNSTITRNNIPVPGYCKINVIPGQNATGSWPVYSVKIGTIHPKQSKTGGIQVGIDCYNSASVDSVTLSHNGVSGSMLLSVANKNGNATIENNDKYNVDLNGSLVKFSNQKVTVNYDYSVTGKKPGNIDSSYIISVLVP